MFQLSSIKFEIQKEKIFAEHAIINKKSLFTFTKTTTTSCQKEPALVRARC